jgi:hypothetical protein
MKKIILLLLLLLPFKQAAAKLASFDDASSRYDVSKLHVEIDEEGKSVEIFEQEYTILKESAQNLAASYRMFYNAASQKIEILEAKSIFQGKEYKVEKKHIQDKPLFSSPAGFDEMRQILIAFPNTSLGAKIYLKYKTTTFKVPFEKFYGDQFSFGANEYDVNRIITINSALPLHLAVQDPKGSLRINKDKKDNFHQLTVELIKPIYTAAVNESGKPSDKYFTYVTVSSLKSWPEFAKKNYHDYAKIYQQELPPLFEEIRKNASQKTGEVAQLSSIISALQDEIRYLGDWKTVDGGFKPRDFSEIAKSRVGDCKDYASSLVAIASKLGYKANIVIVTRGVSNSSSSKLPVQEFNHAMAKVVGKNNQVYWLDPTNVQTMVDGIFPDIAGKKVLVLDELNASYEQIPTIDPKHASITSSQEITPMANNWFKISGESVLKNEMAQPITGIGLYASMANIKDSLLDSISQTSLTDKNDKHISLASLNSRLVEDINIKYSFKQDNKTVNTNLGKAFALDYARFSPILDASEEWVGDVYIDTPRTTEIKRVFKGIKVENPESLDFVVDTKWLNYERKFKHENNDLVMQEKYILYKSYIDNEDLKGKEFKKLQHELNQYVKGSMLVFSKM